MDQYIIHHIRGIITYQPGVHCYWDDATLYHLLEDFKKEMKRQGCELYYKVAVQYQDLLLARGNVPN